MESRKAGRVRAKRSPGTGRVQGRKQGMTMPSPSWPTLAWGAGGHSLRDVCSVGPRTHAASQDG
ncbi:MULTISPECIES: hypothetical protein [Acetobacter]|uniref:hypothetical protein n=1 Tax=Acetobacter TaxID=434 RepID=UPI00156BB131|nr:MULTISPECIES: hypothetical protein [Acetobacter]